MQVKNGISFHEATLVHITRSQDEVVLSLEGVFVDGELKPVSITLNGIKKLSWNEVEVETLVLPYDDGEILTLKHTPTTLYALVEFMDFSTHQSRTDLIEATCDSVRVEIL